MNSKENLDFEIEQELENEILYDVIEEEMNKKTFNSTNSTVKQKKRKKNSKFRVEPRIRYKLKKDIQIKTVIILIMTLLVNTYAWFIYISTISTTLNVHIKDWKFELTNGGDSEDFTFVVDEIYPGVNTESTAKEIIAKNQSHDTTALLSCNIKTVKILYDKYEVGQEYIDGGVTKRYESIDLFKKITEDEYPFKIQLLIVQENADGGEVISYYDGETPFEMPPSTEAVVRMQIVWPYETGSNENEIKTSDAIDTFWGNEAYRFAEDPAKAGEYSIVIQTDITATQKSGSTPPASP